MKGTSKKTALTQTTKEYASRSSIHGISYLFDLELGIADRLLWSFLVLAFAAVAAALTWNLWIQWRNEQVNAFMYKKVNSRLNHPSIVQALLTLNQTTEYSIEILGTRAQPILTHRDFPFTNHSRTSLIDLKSPPVRLQIIHRDVP